MDYGDSHTQRFPRLRATARKGQMNQVGYSLSKKLFSTSLSASLKSFQAVLRMARAALKPFFKNQPRASTHRQPKTIAFSPPVRVSPFLSLERIWLMKDMPATHSQKKDGDELFTEATEFSGVGREAALASTGWDLAEKGGMEFPPWPQEGLSYRAGQPQRGGRGP